MKFTALALSLLAAADAKAPKHHEFEAVEAYTFKEFTRDFNKVRLHLAPTTCDS
jgi:hypothetical protein